MYKLVINFHIVVSSVFVLLAVIVLGRSIFGAIKGKKYNNVDNYLSIFLIIFLYFELISGVLLYFFLRPQLSDANLSLAEINERSSLQFWAIEHLALMLFATMLAQLGRVFILKAKDNTRKHKNTSFYYGISFLMVLISVGIAIIK